MVDQERALPDPATEMAIRTRLLVKYPSLTRPAAPAELDPGMTPVQIAQWLVDNRFVQTSRRYRHFGRVPPAEPSACAALAEIETAHCLRSLEFGHPAVAYWIEHYETWAKHLGEQHAYKHFAGMWSDCVASCHITFEAPTPEHVALVTAYQKLGGGAWPWWLG